MCTRMLTRNSSTAPASQATLLASLAEVLQNPRLGRQIPPAPVYLEATILAMLLELPISKCSLPHRLLFFHLVSLG